jgi:hypothetical protein
VGTVLIPLFAIIVHETEESVKKYLKKDITSTRHINYTSTNEKNHSIVINDTSDFKNIDKIRNIEFIDTLHVSNSTKKNIEISIFFIAEIKKRYYICIRLEIGI